jgi:hypothetical protein
VGVTDTAQRDSTGCSYPTTTAAFDSDVRGENVLESETDLPPAALSEIASILAHGYLRYRASLRRMQVAESVNPPQHSAPETGLASRPAQSVHVTVVNARSTGEN